MKSFLCLNKSILFVLTLCGIGNSAIAQKVNNIQSGSVWAPPAVKIDGDLTEWGNALQAYNKTTHLWYTVANDDKNLYLAIKSTDMDNNNKVLAGGISFTVNTEGKKKDKNAFVITYPVISSAGGGRRGGRRGGFGQDQDAPDTAAIRAQQKQTLAASKEISALGFKQITDTLISIYNQYGIKAAANIDTKGNFIYELAVPLAMLGLQAATPKEIAYNIKVNGLQLNFTGGFGKSMNLNGSQLNISGGGRGGGGGFGGGGRSGNGTFGSASLFGGNKKSSSSGTDISDLTSPVDFWGRYTLAVSGK